MSGEQKPKAGDARPCKACGMPIEFRIGPAGRLIPLQRVATLYALNDQLSGGNLVELKPGPSIEAVFVSHFATCPSASSFSKKSKG